MDRPGEALEHEIHRARVSFEHVKRVGAAYLHNRGRDYSDDGGLATAVLEQCQCPEELSPTIESHQQLAAVFVLEQRLHETAVDHERVGRRIAAVIDDFAEAKTAEMHVRIELLPVGVAQNVER